MTVHVDLVGDRIELRGSVGGRTQALAKSVPKGSYRVRPDKHWRYPLTVATCRALRKAFGDQLIIGHELNEWARLAIFEAERIAELRDADAAELVNVPVYAPRIAAAMESRPYQQVGAAFIASAGHCMITDQPRLGKTIQVLGGIVERQGSDVGIHLVLCPRLAVPLVWAAQIQHWLGDRVRVFALRGTREQRQRTLDDALEWYATYEQDVFVIGNIEMARAIKMRVCDCTHEQYRHPAQACDVRGCGCQQFTLNAKLSDRFAPSSEFKPEHHAQWPDLFGVDWSTVVVDESHRAVIKAKGDPSATRVGFMRLQGSGQRIAMSGTPMRGKPHQLWGTLNWLRPREFSSYWDWVEQYYEVVNDFWGGLTVGDFKPGGLDQLAHDLRDISLRRTKEEVAPDLPPKVYSGAYLIPGDDNSPKADWLEMTPKQAKQYERLLRDGTVYGKLEEKMANGHLAVATREMQIANAYCDIMGGELVPVMDECPKFEYLINLFDSLEIEPDNEGDPCAKIIIASQFTSFLEMIARGLGALHYSFHLLTGKVTSDRKRVAMCSDFQSDNSTARILLINTQVAGVAIDLDAADDLVILDETYIPDDQEQLENRPHSLTRARQLTIHKPRMLGTIEEEKAFLTAARYDEQRYILDGIRGVGVAREIYEQSKSA